jgi:hypothetical protein
MAQTPANPAAAAVSSISGVVKDAESGQPLPDYTLSTYLNASWSGEMLVTTSSTKTVSATTDPSGRYKLSGLPPGEYRIQANGPRGISGILTRSVALAGQDLEGIDFKIAVNGVIAGKVVDENKEPMPDMTVFLVSKEYFLGSAGTFLKDAARTNDRGEFAMTRVLAGQPYYLLVEKRTQMLPARSEAPLNPSLRKRAAVRTWYPNSTSADGASPITLRSGERREGVRIEVKKSQSYCVEGILMAQGGPAGLYFSIEARKPSSGPSNGMGMYSVPPGGQSGPGGDFRICDLYPGSYRLSATQRSSGSNAAPPAFGVMDITIADRDIQNLRVAASPGSPLEGEVVWDGAAPETQTKPAVSISLGPLFRASFSGERTSARVDIPGPFSLPGVFPDDYSARARVSGPGLYVKDIIYGGRSVLYEPLRVGSAMQGSGLRVVVARDGAKLSVQAKNKDGNPAQNVRVVILPAETSSEAALAARMVNGQTNQLGRYDSITLPPGKYYAGAIEDAVEYTPEAIGKLWRSRTKFKEVDLPPSGSAQMNLELVKVE